MSPIEVETQQRNPELPAGWARTKFGEIYELAYGKSLTKGVRNTNGKYPVYGSNGIVGYHDIFLVEGPALVVGRKGAAGVVTLSTKPCWPIDTTYYVRDSGHVDIRFSFYLLTSLRLSQFDRSTAIPGLNRDDAYDLVIRLPPLPEQHRIVTKIEELFSELDKGVQSLEKAREQLKVYRQAVLKHAFEGKLTAQWREENKDKLEKPEQLLARIKREREARYEQQLKEWKTAVKEWESKGKSGKKLSKPKKTNEPKMLTSDDLPTLPEGWAWFQYGGLCSLIRNGISKKPEGNSGKKIFRISAVRPMEFDLSDVRFISGDSSQFAGYHLQQGDLIFTRYNGSRAYVGVCAEYKSDGTHLYPDKLIRTQLGTSQTISGYLEKAVNCGESRNFIESRIRTTAGQSGISGSDIKDMPVSLCSPSEQLVVQGLLDEELARVSRLLTDTEKILGRAEILRQSILQKAFAGQLVAQDPHDESASILLARISAAKNAEKPRAGA